MDNYLGTYERIKVLLRRGFDVETICQVTGKAPRTVAQYLVIIECYTPDLLQNSHRQWLVDRRKSKALFAPPESLAPMTESLEKEGTSGTKKLEKHSQGSTPAHDILRALERRSNQNLHTGHMA